MACRLDGTKPLSEPMLGCCQFDPSEQMSVKFEIHDDIYIQENRFQNVAWEMAAILSRPQCVNVSLCGIKIEIFDMKTSLTWYVDISQRQVINLVA